MAGKMRRRLGFRRGSERCDAAMWYRHDGLSLEFDGSDARLQFVRAAAA